MDDWISPSRDREPRSIEFGTDRGPVSRPRVPDHLKDWFWALGGVLVLLMGIVAALALQTIRAQREIKVNPRYIMANDSDYMVKRREFLATAGTVQVKEPEPFLDETVIEVRPKQAQPKTPPKPAPPEPTPNAPQLPEGSVVIVRQPGPAPKPGLVDEKTAPASRTVPQGGKSSGLKGKIAPAVGNTGAPKVTGWTWYSDDRFKVQVPYPTGWTVRQYRKGNVLRVTFLGGRNVSIMVEVNERVPDQDPAEDWAEKDQHFRGVYGNKYEFLGIQKASLGGHPAAAWNFELTKGGVTLRKIDVGAVVSGNGYAVLGSAPPGAFDSWEPVFQKVIERIKIG